MKGRELSLLDELRAHVEQEGERLVQPTVNEFRSVFSALIVYLENGGNLSSHDHNPTENGDTES